MSDTTEPTVSELAAELAAVKEKLDKFMEEIRAKITALDTGIEPRIKKWNDRNPMTFS